MYVNLDNQKIKTELKEIGINLDLQKDIKK